MCRLTKLRPHRKQKRRACTRGVGETARKTVTAGCNRGREDEGISRGRMQCRVSLSRSLLHPTGPVASCLLFAANNAAVFNKMLPYSPGHKANINYEGACRGHDEEKKMVLTGTHRPHPNLFPVFLSSALSAAPSPSPFLPLPFDRGEGKRVPAFRQTIKVVGLN